MLIVYGIRNCDTVKKARRWLEDQHIDYKFHDFRVSGVNPELLQLLLSRFCWQELINTRGLTWRKLSAEQQAAVTDNDSALRLMNQYPTVIRRPIIVNGTHVLIGFNVARYQKFIKEVER